MTVGNLIAILEDYDENLEVEVYTQPSWPLRHCLRGVTTRNESLGEQEDENTDEHDNELDYERAERLAKFGTNTVVLVTSDAHPTDGSPYGEKCAWEIARR